MGGQEDWERQTWAVPAEGRFPWGVLPWKTGAGHTTGARGPGWEGRQDTAHLHRTAEPEADPPSRHISPARAELPGLARSGGAFVHPQPHAPLLLRPRGERAPATECPISEDPEPARQPRHQEKNRTPSTRRDCRPPPRPPAGLNASCQFQGTASHAGTWGGSQEGVAQPIAELQVLPRALIGLRWRTQIPPPPAMLLRHTWRHGVRLQCRPPP